MDLDPTLASILTVAGAAVASTLVTTFVQLAKGVLPVIKSRSWEQALALTASAGLVILASYDRHIANATTTPSDVFVSFVAWLMIAKLATGIYDEATAAPGSFRS